MVGGLLLVVPHVLADVEAQPESRHLHHATLQARLEVAVLVEHVVRRQERLRHLIHDAAALDHDGVVVQPLAVRRGVLHRCADDERDVGGCLRDEVVQRVLHVLQKRRSVQEVHRRVARHAQLGENSDAGAVARGAVGAAEDAGAVAREVPDGGVDLAESDFHRREAERAGDVLGTNGRPKIGFGRRTRSL